MNIVTEMDMRMNGWIQTVSGKALYPLEPRPQEICIEDIAFGLAGEYRFANQCRARYTVAQHCVLGSRICDRGVALQFLLHDASEGLGFKDIARQLKRLPAFDAYRDNERTFQGCIYERFGLPFDEDLRVKAADTLMLGIEVRDLMQPLVRPDEWEWCIGPARNHPFKVGRVWGTAEAEERFLDRFRGLTTGGDLGAAARLLVAARKRLARWTDPESLRSLFDEGE